MTAPGPRSAKDRDLDAVSLKRGNDGRIVNRVGIAFEHLEGGKREQRPGTGKSIAEAHALEPVEPREAGQVQVRKHGRMAKAPEISQALDSLQALHIGIAAFEIERQPRVVID